MSDAPPSVPPGIPDRALLSALFDGSPGFMALHEGPAHRFVWANAAYRRLVGGRDVEGREAARALPEAAAQGFVAILDRVLASGEPVEGRGAPYRAPPGTAQRDAVLDFDARPVAGPDGRPWGVLVSGQDVTDAHQARAALEDSEGRFRLMANASPQIAWVTDAQGRVEFFNDRWHDYTGAPRQAPDAPADAAAVVQGYVHPDDADATALAFARALASGGPFEVEQRVRAASGEWRWHLARGLPHRDPATGRILRFFGSTVDIHAVKQAEAALREVNRLLEERVAARTAEVRLLATVVETTDAFVQVADTGFTWLAVNRAAADEFARIYGPRPAPGLNMLDLLGDQPEHREAVRAVWGRALAGEAFTETGTFGAHDRDRRTYEMRFNVLRDPPGDPEGRVTGAFQIVTDVTDRLAQEARLQEAEARLLQAQKMEALGQLTGGVAHDFNNLLTPIMGSLDALSRRGALEPRERRLVAGALEAADRARALVGRLLAFARRQPLQPGPVDLAALLDGMRGLLGSTLRPGQVLELETPAALPRALADANQLELVLLNLAVNARDAMPEGGRLRLSLREESVAADHPHGLAPGPYLRLEVADTGTGMDEATLARATEPFFSTKDPGKGTGLGLSMAHGLALQLGGALGLRSAPGEGTTVTLWLRAADATPEAAPEAPAAAGALGGRALLVDDDPLARATAAEMLRELGFEVTEAEGAAAALAQADPPDLLVTDHRMPDLTGSELARRLRLRWPGLPVLVVSGFADGPDPLLPRLRKPFRRDELAAGIRWAQGRVRPAEDAAAR